MASDVAELLPLKPAHYLILLSLAEVELHGYGLKKDIARRTGGRVILGAGSLYRSLHQLAERRLIEPSAREADPVLEDERRSYFRITDFGRAVAAAETERLAELVDDARAAGLKA
jgi:DNA-binding PadR family transcriptional regulator